MRSLILGLVGIFTIIGCAGSKPKGAGPWLNIANDENKIVAAKSQSSGETVFYGSCEEAFESTLNVLLQNAKAQQAGNAAAKPTVAQGATGKTPKKPAKPWAPRNPDAVNTTTVVPRATPTATPAPTPQVKR